MHGVIKYITDRLLYDADEAKALAYWVVEERTGMSRSEILSGREIPDIADIDTLIERLNRYEPVQYIFGHTEWLGLDLMVNSSTLIPRPETAELIALLPDDSRSLRVLDIGTGSGCIAIATQKRHPAWQVSAIDISQEALSVAAANAARAGVDIHFSRMDILNERPQTPYDIIISNPPYIREEEKKNMRDNVLQHEPHTALFVPDQDPLLFYRRIAELHAAPTLYLEINEALSLETATLLQAEGYRNIQIHQDSYGKDRFITARIPE